MATYFQGAVKSGDGFSETAIGDVIQFGGVGIAAKNGLHVVVGGTGTVNVLYT